MMQLCALSCVFIVILSVNLGFALECYVCHNQEDNTGKCVKSIKTCEYGEDVCQTEVRWGSTPYWQQGALKQYYVSKTCSTAEKCAAYRKGNMPLCTHIQYQDWKCSECCKGDRCNYYIISGSSKYSIYATLLLSTTLFNLCRLF